MRRTWLTLMLVLAATLGAAAQAAGQVTPIGPFTGTYFDDFNNDIAPGSGNHSQIDIFGGFCTVRSINGGAVKCEFSSERGGDLVVPRSSPAFLGQIAITEWTFDAPVYRLGGYWENNSRFDDANITFIDANNNVIATLIVDNKKNAQTWTWNGWESTVPFTKVQVAGNDTLFLGGFIWQEDFSVTVSSVPEPSTYALLGVTGAIGTWVYYYRRLRAKKSPDLV